MPFSRIQARINGLLTGLYSRIVNAVECEGHVQLLFREYGSEVGMRGGSITFEYMHGLGIKVRIVELMIQ